MVKIHEILVSHVRLLFYDREYSNREKLLLLLFTNTVQLQIGRMRTDLITN